MVDIKNVFISHIHEDDAGLSDLKDLLSKHGMEVRDASIDSSSPNEAKSEDYIKNGILAPGINWASTLIVYITPETKNSEWVNWEIEYAAKCDKRIVGVWAQGCNKCEVPDALAENADAMVGWNGSSIVDAVNGNCDAWEGPDGAPRDAVGLKRHPC
jgi:hypothetical protein